jgi:hypothetical protein
MILNMKFWKGGGGRKRTFQSIQYPSFQNIYEFFELISLLIKKIIPLFQNFVHFK